MGVKLKLNDVRKPSEEIRAMGRIAKKCGHKIEYNFRPGGRDCIILRRHDHLWSHTIDIKDGWVTVRKWSADGYDMTGCTHNICLSDPDSIERLEEVLRDNGS